MSAHTSNSGDLHLELDFVEPEDRLDYNPEAERKATALVAELRAPSINHAGLRSQPEPSSSPRPNIPQVDDSDSENEGPSRSPRLKILQEDDSDSENEGQSNFVRKGVQSPVKSSGAEEEQGTGLNLLNRLPAVIPGIVVNGPDDFLGGPRIWTRATHEQGLQQERGERGSLIKPASQLTDNLSHRSRP